MDASLEDADYVAVAQAPTICDTAVQIFKVRNGGSLAVRILCWKAQMCPMLEVNLHGVLIGSFIQRFYDSAAFVPKLILVQAMPEDAEVLEEWLTTRRGSRR